MGEFCLIRELAERFGASSGGAAERIGDDAVMLDLERPVLALDTMVEGVHFRLDWSTPADLGWKLLASNISDLHACGARPTAWMLSLSLPGTADDARHLVEGLGDGFSEFLGWLGERIPLVGGDTTSSPGGLVVSVTAIGACAGRFLGRSDARPGESVWLSGEPGWAAAGLHALETGSFRLPGWSDSHPAARALQAHRRPVPGRLADSSLEQGLIGAAVDVSDGLAADLMHVARASGVRIVLDVPIPGEEHLLSLAHGDRDLVRRWQLDGGEDFLLAVTAGMSPGDQWIRVGAVEAGQPSLTVRSADGQRRSMVPRGWDHFR